MIGRDTEFDVGVGLRRSAAGPIGAQVLRWDHLRRRPAGSLAKK